MGDQRPSSVTDAASASCGRIAARSILFVAPSDQAGGAERVLAIAARELSLRPDWDVEIAILADVTPSFLNEIAGRARITYGRWGGRFGTEWLLLPRLRRRRYDVVYSSHMRINAFLSLARRLGLLRCGRLVARESNIFAERHAGVRLAAYRALYRFYGQQDLVIAQTSYMSERLGEMLSGKAHAKVRVVPNPVDVDGIRTTASAPLDATLAARLFARRHIVWCGRLIDFKQPALAIEVLAELRRTHGLDFGLVMTGAGPLEGAVRRLVVDLDLEDAVMLTGRLSNPYAVMAACPFGLMTSRPLSEGFPNVLLEMMAVGVSRIVTTRCAGDLDTLDGVLVAGHSSSELAAALAAASRDLESRRRDYSTALAPRTPAAFVANLLGAHDA